MPPGPDFDALTTPVAWADADGRIAGTNLACARWLGVSGKRLAGLPLAALEFEGEALERIRSMNFPARIRRSRCPAHWPRRSRALRMNCAIRWRA